MTRFLLLVLLLFALSAGTAAARAGDDDQDVRVAGYCTRGATASLRIRAHDEQIEIRFRLRQTRGHGLWRITVVHERRVSSRVQRRTRRAGDSFELRRMVSDLAGSDTILVRAWGPAGRGCSASATLPERR